MAGFKSTHAILSEYQSEMRIEGYSCLSNKTMENTLSTSKSMDSVQLAQNSNDGVCMTRRIH